jgi:hypothetical protein
LKKFLIERKLFFDQNVLIIRFETVPDAIIFPKELFLQQSWVLISNRISEVGCQKLVVFKWHNWEKFTNDLLKIFILYFGFMKFALSIQKFCVKEESIKYSITILKESSSRYFFRMQSFSLIMYIARLDIQKLNVQTQWKKIGYVILLFLLR